MMNRKHSEDRQALSFKYKSQIGWIFIPKANESYGLYNSSHVALVALPESFQQIKECTEAILKGIKSNHWF